MKFFVTIVSMLFFQSLAAKDLNKEITSFKVYDQLIAPVFEARCQNCHGENKDKGKLRMHTRELLLKGGRGAGQDIIIKGILLLASLYTVLLYRKMMKRQCRHTKKMSHIVQ